MIVFDQLLASAFESYAGSQPIDWINRYASAHGCKINSALIRLDADNSGFTLLDYLRYDQLFNQSSVSKAFAHFLADSKDEIERFASFDLLETEANYSDWLSAGHDAGVVPAYIEIQRHIHRVNKPVRVAFFEMMLGCAADYAQAFNRAAHQLVDKASSNAIASSDFQEAKIIQRLSDAIALAGSAEKLDSAFQTIASQQQTIGLLVSQQAPAQQQQAGQVVASSKRGRPPKDSTGSRTNEHELYQALEKWWLKMGKPSRPDFMKKLRALNEDTPNEYGLILHSNAVPIKRMVQHEQNNITFTLEHIQKNVLKEFEQKHSA